MAETILHNALGELDGMRPVQPLRSPEGHGKFSTVVVHEQGGQFGFLKYVNDPTSSSWEDLENETLWAQQNGPTLLENSGIKVPEIINHGDDFKWVLFEYLGRTATLPDVTAGSIGPAAQTAIAVCSLSLERPALTDLEAWYLRRINSFLEPVKKLNLREESISTLVALSLGKLEGTSTIEPGIIHGDLKDSNIMISKVGEIGLVDAEFGTLQTPPDMNDGRDRRRSEHDKPRYHDIAYYYHLMRQTGDEMGAEKFLQEVKANLSTDDSFDNQKFDQEFTLSVVERTLSMAYHFLLKPGRPKDIADPRRQQAAHYVLLLDEVLSVLE
jgi:hypothetical protein